MMSFGNAKLLKRTSNNLVKVGLKHVQQTGNNNCWAASAQMISHTVNVGYHQDQQALARDFVMRAKRTDCTHPECIIHNDGGSSNPSDLPLCLNCKVKLLAGITGTIKYSKRCHSQKQNPSAQLPVVTDVRRQLSLHCPVGVYSDKIKQAHYSVIYGCFSIFYDTKALDFLMIADPWENGHGVSDFATFVNTGKYMRTQERKSGADLHWNASLEGK